ncbi:hypothetical protein AB0H17_17265 [Streptomyces olivoreticuli]
MTTYATWRDAVADAERQLGHTLPALIDRTVTAIGDALPLDHRAAFYNELATLGEGGMFEAFLDNWWTQATVSAAADDDRERAIDVADLAVTLWALHTRSSERDLTNDQVEALLNDAEAAA